MDQTTISHFSGLQIQPNSFTVAPGTFEIIDNAVVSQDFLITKNLGLYVQYQLVNTQVINRLFDYDLFRFALSQDTLYKLWDSGSTGSASATASSATVTVTLAGHGLTTGDYISQVTFVNSDAFLAAFPNRHVDLEVIRQVTVLSSSSFTFQALNAAQASASGGTLTWIYYTRMSGETIAITSHSHTAAANGNLYFTTDTGVLKLEAADRPILNAGIPQALDLNGFIGRGANDNGTGNYNGILPLYSSYAYRVLFGRTDANNNLILGPPSSFIVLDNTLSFSIGNSQISYSGTTVSVVQTAHGYSSGQVIYIYTALSPSPAIPDGAAFTITVIDANTFSFQYVGSWVGSGKSFIYGVPVVPSIYFSIPSQVNTTDFIYQI